MAPRAVSPAIAGERLERLRGRLGDVSVLTDAEALRERSRDTYWKAAARAVADRGLVADAVVRPRSPEEVASALAAAAAEGIPVVPRGGGSGSQGGAVPDAGGIVLDLGGLDEIIELDEAALTVRAQAGVPGLRLEEWLNERGYTFPHYPASLHLAQVGGYLAAKGSGVLSTKYGKIEELVASIEVALPSGERVRTVPIPRHAVGPDLNQLFIGSEGTLGVITEATLLLRPLPEHRSFRLIAFDDLATGGGSAPRPRGDAAQPGPDPRGRRLRGGARARLRRPAAPGRDGGARGPALADGERRARRGARDRQSVVGEPLPHLLPAVPPGAAQHLGHDRPRGRVRADPAGVRGRPRPDARRLRELRPHLHRPLLPLVSLGDDGLRALHPHRPAG